MRNKMGGKVLAVAVAVIALAGTAMADEVNFNTEPSGGVPNGYSSPDSALVRFVDTVGGDLYIDNYGIQSAGSQALAVNSDFDGSHLQMLFSAPMTTLSLDFGNDDPSWINPGATAELRLYSGATLVGSASMLLNGDDVMNQTISYSGAAFNIAEFWYNVVPPGPLGNEGLIEVVDNIQFGARPVPEPATLVLLGSGVMGLAAAYRRRKLSA